MADLSTLAKSMRTRAAALPQLANGIAIAAVTAGLQEMVDITPVDTSEAESNWRVGVGSAPAGSLAPFVPGHKGSTRAASAESVLSEGSSALREKNPGVPVWLSNTAKHIIYLDAGSSSQFAGGFIARAMLVMRAAVQSTSANLWK